MSRATVLLLLVLSAAGTGPAAGGDAAPRVDDAWIRAAPPVAQVMAGYLTLRAGAQAIELLGADCDGFGRVEIHETVLTDSVASMRPLPRLRVEAGDSVTFAPGGLHLMLLEPERIPPAGAVVDCRLELAGGGTLAMTASVRRDDAEDPHAHHHH
jgi:hypothetical protein